MKYFRALLTTTALVATACTGSGSDSLTEVDSADTAAPATAPATEAPPATDAPPPTAPSTVGAATEADPEPAAVAEVESGPINIETTVDFEAVQTTGSFEVDEGADLLGCSAGSLTEFGGPTGITNVMTCEDGEREGTFTVKWQILNSAEGPGDVNGPWSVVESSGDFTGLNGEGLWSGTGDDDFGYGSFPGTIEFGDETIAPPPPVDDGRPAWEQGNDAQVPAGTVRLPEFGGIQFELDVQRQILQRGGYTIVAIEDGTGGAPVEVDLLAPTVTSSGEPLTTTDELIATLTDDIGATLVPIGDVETSIGVAQGFDFTVEDQDSLDEEVAYLEVGEGDWAPFPFGEFWILDTERGLFMVTAEGVLDGDLLEEAKAYVSQVLETIEFIDLDAT